MRCVNCTRDFEKREKGFRRISLITEKHTEHDVSTVFGLHSVTPKSKKDERFLCTDCEKLLRSAQEGGKAKEELLKSTDEESYIARKRKKMEALTPAKKQRLAGKSTPKMTRSKMQTGARYFQQYHYSRGFRYYIKRSRTAMKALRTVILRKTRKDINDLLKMETLPNMGRVSIDSFKKMDFGVIIREIRRHVPLLYDTIVGAMTRSGKENDLTRGQSKKTLTPILGFILCLILQQLRPKKASLLQKMNAVQMWRAGCKRSLFKDFAKLGISVTDTTLYATLDKLRRSFDEELLEWKYELQQHVFPEAEVEPPLDAFATEPSSQTSELSDPSIDTDSSTESGSISPQTSDLEEWENISDEEEDVTISYGDTSVPKGYTICWDNVGKAVKARRHTRNHGNKYQIWALAYVSKNRINTTHYTDQTTVAASEIPLQAYTMTSEEESTLRERLVNMVQRILVKYLPLFECVADVPATDMRHEYDIPSCEKSELFNIGVIDENPSTTAGVINILEVLHKYVPKDSHGNLYKIITWGDGLSCERHNDAQNARANCDTPSARLQGLEPAPQEFHKRMLLMQDTMDKLFDGKSACDKGTLFHLKNVFNQRAVSRHVSECFNYVSDFLTFVTEGYTVLFAMDLLGLDEINDVPSNLSYEEVVSMLNETSSRIVDSVWINVVFPPPKQTDTDGYEYDYCFCKTDLEDDNAILIECENDLCLNGQWFHIECVGVDANNMPDSWFCSDLCSTVANSHCICKKIKKDEPMIECCSVDCPGGKWFHAACVDIAPDKLPKEGEAWYCSRKCLRTDKKKSTSKFGLSDKKFEYTKLLMWRGLNDLIRRDAVRHNNGRLMNLYWKCDLPVFQAGNHNKYVILAHRFIASINGFLCERLREDLIWNRTINLRGGRGANLEADLVNEFLNREFKDSIKGVGGRTTQETIERHGKLAGGVGRVIDDVFENMVEAPLDRPGKTVQRNHEDITYFVNLLKDENLTRQIPGRYHKAFPKMDSTLKVNVEKLYQKIKKLSSKLDKARRVAV